MSNKLPDIFAAFFIIKEILAIADQMWVRATDRWTFYFLKRTWKIEDINLQLTMTRRPIRRTSTSKIPTKTNHWNRLLWFNKATIGGPRNRHTCMSRPVAKIMSFRFTATETETKTEIILKT